MQLRQRAIILILILLIVGLAFNCVLAPRGIRDLLLLRRHRLQMEAMIRHEEKENSALATEIDRLKNDPDYQERLIRRELGYARPNELIYRFTGDDSKR